MAQQRYLSGLEFDHIWLDLETNPEITPGIKEPFLLLIEKKTGNVFTLLVYLKSLLDSNYSRKTSQFKNREVNIPQEVAIPEEKQKLIHWKWAEESSSELKDYLKKHVFEEKRVESPTGHLMLVVLPVAYVALVHYEDAQCKPLTLAFHRAIRHSTYWPWLPGMDKKEEMVRRLDELSGFDANNVDQKLFHGPVDFIETAKKFMFAFPSEAEKDKYKKGRNQNCPFERDEENNIHALLESSQVGLNGMGPPPQEGHQAPTAIGFNPAAGTRTNGNDHSLSTRLVKEVEKLREEVKEVKVQYVEEVKRIQREHENGVKPILFAFFQSQVDKTSPSELPRIMKPHIERLFIPPAPQVTTSAPFASEPRPFRQADYPFFKDYPENIQIAFRKMIEGNGNGLAQLGPPPASSPSHAKRNELMMHREWLKNRNKAETDSHNQGRHQGYSSQEMLPNDPHHFMHTKSLILNGGSQGMGQVQVQVQAPQEREPKRMKLESQEEGNTLGSQVDKPIQTKVENMTNMMTLVKGEEGGSSPRTGHYTGHNRGEDVIAEDRAAKAKSDFQLRSMQAQLGIYPQN